MSEAIKHCPFCGEFPKITDTEDIRFIGCESEKCYIAPSIGSVDFYDLTIEEMIQVWNDRQN